MSTQLDANTQKCHLCGTDSPLACAAIARSFHHCPQCDFIFVPTLQHLSEDAQRERYLQHHNTIDDAGYVATLREPIALLRKHAPAAQRVLDYGCGPTPVLVELLRREGFDAHGYDPLFPSGDALTPPYDAVISTETFEHFADPAQELRRIMSLLGPKGLLIVTTHFHAGPQALQDWWYARDKTHVAFYSLRTLRAIAAGHGMALTFTDGTRVACFARD
jgi:2-polyprenyl-3-methyl-5-hydroxy-6-metoxy-1,4-benzoquinol methylase